MQPGRERQLVTAAVLLGSFLAALEATAVGELGGVSAPSASSPAPSPVSQESPVVEM